jgi:UDP-N-acetylmuramate dehydrogenase
VVKGFKKKLMSVIENFYSEEGLAKYSWFNLGGCAEFFYRPDNALELASFLKKNTKHINIIGAGSNTLIRDGGVKGVTIKLSSKFSFVKLLDDETLQVGAATLDKKISDFATQKSLSGFEFLSCIPGSIGGGIRMNSGCYGNDISKILVSVEIMDLAGNIKKISREEIKFYYRGCDLKNNLIILSANFKGKLSYKEKNPYQISDQGESKQGDFTSGRRNVYSFFILCYQYLREHCSFNHLFLMINSHTQSA